VEYPDDEARVWGLGDVVALRMTRDLLAFGMPKSVVAGAVEGVAMWWGAETYLDWCVLGRQAAEAIRQGLDERHDDGPAWFEIAMQWEDDPDATGHGALSNAELLEIQTDPPPVIRCLGGEGRQGWATANWHEKDCALGRGGESRSADPHPCPCDWSLLYPVGRMAAEILTRVEEWRQTGGWRELETSPYEASLPPGYRLAPWLWHDLPIAQS
jgi:hypothetical protein